LHGYLATAARVKYPAALQRCKFDTPLLAAGSLISGRQQAEPVPASYTEVHRSTRFAPEKSEKGEKL